MTREVAANASATRAFFVDMLVRDIGVDGAVFDLIDNAVDAAYSHAGSGGNLTGSRIEVSLKVDGFEIHDNCGGMDTATAMNYAFRFGRAVDYNPRTQIGEFGIGMKRAVFRLGKRFHIDSSTTEERFTIDVNVAEWREQEGDWTFPMIIADHPAPEPGTGVVVHDLHAGVEELFSRQAYADGILREVADRYNEAIKRELEIMVNDTPADIRLHEVLSGTGVSPLNYTEELAPDGQQVELQIVSGIGPDRRPVTESGWNVYCNGRLVVKADRTELTGWGTDDPESGTGTPAWHPQYARFRGFVYFRSQYPGALPWTTTKTEIDEHSEVYRHALGKMRSAIRSFSRFTNELKQEREDFEQGDGRTPQHIASALTTARYRAIGEVPEGKFKVPERETKVIPPTPPGPRIANILFKVEATRVEEVQEALGLSTYRQVGEIAFERLYDEEVG